ncbi:MAG: hypothetical protein JST79_00230 [Acidobacteria bacterium]|jgi:hypothetical protein|nr:hypothetical protein [Acidobacteriota bacterium]
MNVFKSILVCFLLPAAFEARAQVPDVVPQVRVKDADDGKVTVVEVAPHFVTAIKLPEPVNSVAIGDPALFQVEHSEHEPLLVLVKALTEKRAETNVLISSIHGRQFSLLLISGAGVAGPGKVDFVLQYKTATSFLVEPEIVPFPLVGQTKAITDQPTPVDLSTEGGNRRSAKAAVVPSTFRSSTYNARSEALSHATLPASLDVLLERQKSAPLPTMYGERIETEAIKRDRLRVGVSEVIDGGQQVIVLFSVMNTSRHAILLMPPQVQLGGKIKSGRIVKRERWAAAEQLAIVEFRLSHRRLGVGSRADGVVVFERPPYKQSNEELFLQMADSGAVDRPALAPMGFGVNSLRQEEDHGIADNRN